MLDVLARGLHRAGHEVILFATADSTCPVPRRSVMASLPPESIGNVADEARQVLAGYDALSGCDVVKFTAAMAVVALALGSLMLVVGGYGALRLGIGPMLSDTVRLIAFGTVTVVYVAFWLALAMLLSVLTRRAATAALAAIALWLVLTLFAGLIAGVVTDAVRPVSDDASAEVVLDQARFELNIRRLSPDQLYTDAAGVLLNPSRQSSGLLVLTPEDLALPSALSLNESLLLAWWQVVTLIAGTIIMFVVAYIVFMRQEVRP